MKVPWTLLGLLLGVGALAMPARAADAVPVANVRLEVQMVSVSIPDSLELVPALRDSKTAEEAWNRLQEMLAQERATLIDWPVLWLVAGERTASESTEEMRHPTEFEPPLSPDRWVRVEEKPVLRPQWDKSVPTAFEVRNMGQMIEVEAAIGEDGDTIGLNFASLHVSFADYRKWRYQQYPLGGGGIGMMPNFLTRKVTTSLRVLHDRPALAGVFVVSKPKPHVELHIVRARAMKLPPEAAFAGTHP